jgi:hypothetical protein
MEPQSTEALRAQIVIRGFSFPNPWRQTPGWMAGLLALLMPAPVGGGPVDLAMPNGRRRENLTLDAASGLLESGKSGSYTLTSQRAEAITLTLTDHGTELDAQVDIPAGPGGVESLESVVERAAALDAHTRPIGTIGPVFWVVLPSIRYPRPLPPRISPHWVPNVIAYFLSRRFYHSGSESIHLSTFQRLEAASPPDDIVRESAEDLLVIRGRGPLTDPKALKRQLSSLESWIGVTLRLPRDQEFLANGDQLWRVWKSARVAPFSFYDEATRIGYKVVAETAANELDQETLAELKELLPLRQLPDGRTINSTVVIFAFREGAVANLRAIRELGGEGALYRDAQGAFWNPDPPGDWVRESR